MSTDDEAQGLQSLRSRQQLQLLAQAIIARARARSSGAQPQAEGGGNAPGYDASTVAAQHVDQAQVLGTAAMDDSEARAGVPEHILASILQQLPSVQQQAPTGQPQQHTGQQQDTQVEQQRDLQALISSLVSQATAVQHTEQQQQQQWYAGQHIQEAAAQSVPAYNEGVEFPHEAGHNSQQSPEPPQLPVPAAAAAGVTRSASLPPPATAAAAAAADFGRSTRTPAFASTRQQQQHESATKQAAGSVTISGKQQQQQMPLPKLRLKRGKNLAAAAAAQALQSDNAAAKISQWKRKPLVFNPTKSPGAAGGARHNPSMFSSGRAAASQAHSISQSQQQQQQQQQQHMMTMQQTDLAAMAAAAGSSDRPSYSEQQQQQKRPLPAGSLLSAYQQRHIGVTTDPKITTARPSVNPDRIMPPQHPQTSYNNNMLQQQQHMLSEGIPTGITTGTLPLNTDEGGLLTADQPLDAAAAAAMPRAALVQQQQQRLQRLQEMQQQLSVLQEQLMQQRQFSARLADTGSGIQQQPLPQISGSSAAAAATSDHSRQRLQSLQSNLSRVLSELQALMPGSSRGRAPVPQFSAADPYATAATAAAAASQSGMAPSLSSVLNQQQQQYHAIYPSEDLSLPAAQQQQQPSESWQALYYPTSLVPAVAADPSAAAAAAATPIGPYLPAAAAAATQSGPSLLSSLPAASSHAQEFRQLLREVRSLPDLLGGGCADHDRMMTSSSRSEIRAQRSMSQTSPLDMAAFKQLLLDMLATHREAKILLQQAVQLGLLPAPSTAAATAAGSSQPEARAKIRARSAAPGSSGDIAVDPDLSEQITTKRRRIDQDLKTPPPPAAAAAAAEPHSSIIAGLETELSLEATASEAAAAAALNALCIPFSSPTPAAAAAVPLGGTSGDQAIAAAWSLGGSSTGLNPTVHLEPPNRDEDANAPSAAALTAEEPAMHGNAPSAAAAAAEAQQAADAVPMSAAAVAAAAAVLGNMARETGQQQQEQSGSMRAPAAVKLETPSTAVADAAATLLPRIAAVMARMQRHMHDLALLAVPSAAELLNARQAAEALVRQAAAAAAEGGQSAHLDMLTRQLQGSSAGTMHTSGLLQSLQSYVTDLQQDLAAAKIAAAASQQEVAQVQQQLAAANQQQRQQQQQVAGAVTHLLTIVNSSTALDESHRLLLVTAGAQLLQSVL